MPIKLVSQLKERGRSPAQRRKSPKRRSPTQRRKSPKRRSPAQRKKFPPSDKLLVNNGEIGIIRNGRWVSIKDK